MKLNDQNEVTTESKAAMPCACGCGLVVDDARLHLGPFARASCKRSFMRGNPDGVKRQGLIETHILHHGRTPKPKAVDHLAKTKQGRSLRFVNGRFQRIDISNTYVERKRKADARFFNTTEQTGLCPFAAADKR